MNPTDCFSFSLNVNIFEVAQMLKHLGFLVFDFSPFVRQVCALLTSPGFYILLLCFLGLFLILISYSYIPFKGLGLAIELSVENLLPVFPQ